MNRAQIIALILLITIVIIVIWKRKPITKQIISMWDDAITWTRINKLHPTIQGRVKAFINAAANEGINLRVTSTNRTWEEQNKLYAQGRTAPGDIVTNARGGESFHNFALAFDVVEMDDNGQPIWTNPNWSRIGELGKSFGFTWGGDWNKPDHPHFHDSFGNSLAELRNKYKSGDFIGTSKFVNLI